MQYRIIKILLINTFLISVGCDRKPISVLTDNDKVESLADEFIESYFRTYPYMALLSSAPDFYPEKLSDNSLEAVRQLTITQEDLLVRLKAINPELLDDNSRTTYYILQNLLETSLAMCTCRMELWNVSPTWTGWQSLFSIFFNLHPLESENQKESALKRLAEIPNYLENEIENLNTGLQLGFSAPQHNVELVIGQMDNLLKANADSPFANFDIQDDPEFTASFERLSAQKIYPAIKKYRDFLRENYWPLARAASSVYENKDGEECYRASLRYYTTTTLSPEGIHVQGLALMDSLLNETRELGKKAFGKSDIREIFTRMNTNPEYLFSNKEEILNLAKQSIAKARVELPKWFKAIPETEIQVLPFPEYQEKTAPAGEAVAAPESGGAGTFYINTYMAPEQSRAGIESLVYHEAIPGHLFQFAMAAKVESNPIATYFYLSGHGEGWALYAERLADEMGLYSSDLERLGMLSNQLLRAARLVVDTGIHAFGWSRGKSVNYLVDYTGLPKSAAEAEVDRYIAVPGQATSYMVGYLEITRLRKRAQEKMSEAFDIKEFHNLILKNGTLPIWLLDKKVSNWPQKSY